MSIRARSALGSIAGAVLLLAGLVFAGPAHASLPGGGSCAKVLLVVARGTSESAGQGRLSTLTRSVDASTSSSVGVFSVSYPATAAFPAYRDSVAAGEKNLRSLLGSLHSGCPSAKFALLGYSQGAQVIGDVLDTKGTQLSSSIASAIKAVVLYGDPTFVSGETYDYGTHIWNEGGIFARGSTDLRNYASRIHSWCDAGDPVCQIAGLDMSVHSGYFSRYNTSATTFVDGKLDI